ncbi:DUF916 and DUF3324 domain-containing protein [Enterococcus viikkiensis]
MKRVCQCGIVSCLFLFMCLVGDKSAAAEFHFSVLPQIPENQRDTTNSYFDVLLQPDQRQDLSVLLRNETDKPVVVEVGVASATTNSNGVVEYSQNAIKKDVSLLYDLKELVKAPSEVTIPPHADIKYALTVHMPNMTFSGILAGGLTFKEKRSEATDSQRFNQKGLAIKNEYSYAVALLLRQREEELAPDLKLLTASAGQVNARNVIQANLQNPKASYLNQLVCRTRITKLNSKKKTYVNTQANLQMAPNSNFNLTIPIEEALDSGKYVIQVEAYGNKTKRGSFTLKNNDKTENYHYHWSLQKEFEVKVEDAREWNASDVTIKESDHVFVDYLRIGWIVLVVILLGVIFIWGKQRKATADQRHSRK